MSENGNENQAFDASEQSSDDKSRNVKKKNETNGIEDENTEDSPETTLDTNGVSLETNGDIATSAEESNVETNGDIATSAEESNVETNEDIATSADESNVETNGDIATSAEESDSASNKLDTESKENEVFSKLETLRSEHYSVLGKARTCYNIRWFVAIYFVVLVLRTCIGSYMYTVANEIWKRYYISTFEFNFIVGVEKIGFILTLIFSSFYGNKFIKPISILSGAILCGIGAIMCCIPYFMLGHREIDLLQDVPVYIEAGLCLHSTVEKNVTYIDQCNQHPAINFPNENTGAYSLLCAGHFLLGVGTAFLVPAGIVYTDEAGRNNDMPLYLGIIISSYGAGNLIGSLFGYWFVSLPEHLKGDILISKWHVGAWWIGFILFGCAIIITSTALVIFPKWISEPKWLLYRKYRAQLKLERWKKREQEARRRRRQRKREKLRKERERRNIKAKHRTSAGSDDNNSSDNGTAAEGNDKVTEHGVNNEKESSKKKRNDLETSDNELEPQNSSVKVENKPDGENKIKEDASNTENVKADINDNKEHKKHYRKNTPSKVRRNPDKTPGNSIDVSENESEAEAEVPTKKKSADERNKQRYKLGRKLEDLPKHLLFLLKRPIFLVTTFSASLSLYLQAGYFMTLTNYFQRQFQYSERTAALIPCAVYGIGVFIGCISSGIFIYKIKLTLKSQLKISLISQVGVIIGLLVVMALGCTLEQSPLKVENKHVKSPCASECDCSLSQLYKVCDKQGTMSFASPCHAGCKKAAVDPVSKTLHYQSCICVNEGELAPEWCESQCTMAVIYVIILLVVVILQSSAYVTVVLLMLRSLPEKLRSITMGFSLWIIHITAFVPGVAIYNSFFTASCTVSNENCQEETECWQYDSTKYRYITHGATIAFIITGLVLLIVSYVVTIKMKQPATLKKELAKDQVELNNVNANGSASSSEPNGVQNKAFSGESSEKMSSV